MYKHNRSHGNTSRNRSRNTDLSIYGPQVGWLHYHDGDNGSGGGGAEDLLCAMMMTLPLMMPFVQGILFGMHLVNLQETQVVCR